MSRENIVVTVNSGCRMVASYELYLMRMAQAMSEDLGRSIKLPHVEHSVFGRIIMREEEKRRQEEVAETLRGGGGEFGYKNQEGSNAPQDVRWAVGVKMPGQVDLTPQNINHTRTMLGKVDSSRRAMTGDEFVTPVGAEGEEVTSRAQEDRDVADRAGG